MLKKYQSPFRLLIIGCFLLASAFSSCKKYVDAGSPVNQLTQDKVFVDSATTLSSVLSLYTYYTTTNIINLNQYGSMSADDCYYFNNSTYDPFRTNTLAVGNFASSIYSSPYQIINLANYNLEGLASTTSLTTNFKNQLTGECEFWRAYCYFNLLNYFGAVPLVINTNALTNAKLPRTDTAKVYDQIISDLLDAKTKLTATYASYTITEKQGLTNILSPLSWQEYTCTGATGRRQRKKPLP